MARYDNLPPCGAASPGALTAKCRDCGRQIDVEMWFPHAIAEAEISATLRSNASREAADKQSELDLVDKN